MSLAIKSRSNLSKDGNLTNPLIAKTGVKVNYVDLIDGVTITETMEDATGKSTKTVVDCKNQSKNTELKPWF